MQTRWGEAMRQAIREDHRNLWAMPSRRRHKQQKAGLANESQYLRRRLEKRGLGIGRAAILITGSLCWCLAGCVEVTSYKLGDNDTFENVSSAIPYTLPRTSFTVSNTYTLNCINDSTTWRIQITPVSTLTPVSVPDPGERYYVKSDDLKSWFKDSQITITSNANQTLASVNGTVNDLVGPSIATAVGIGISVAEAGAIAAVPMARFGTFLSQQAQQAKPPETPKYCGANLNAETGKYITALVSLREKIDARNKDLAGKSTGTDQLIALYTGEIAAISTQYLTFKASFTWTPDPNVTADATLRMEQI